jgi:hypothetical protein
MIFHGFDQIVHLNVRLASINDRPQISRTAAVAAARGCLLADVGALWLARVVRSALRGPTVNQTVPHDGRD